MKNSRAAMNGVDLRAVKRQRAAFIMNANSRLKALARFADGVDCAFESACDDFQEAIATFDKACAEFIEYQSEDPDAESTE